MWLKRPLSCGDRLVLKSTNRIDRRVEYKGIDRDDDEVMAGILDGRRIYVSGRKER